MDLPVVVVETSKRYLSGNNNETGRASAATSAAGFQMNAKLHEILNNGIHKEEGEQFNVTVLCVIQL